MIIYYIDEYVQGGILKMTEITGVYPEIDNWERKNNEDAYVWSDGKNLIINMKKFLPSIDRMRKEDRQSLMFLQTFVIERKLFYKKTDLIAKYLDYYIEFFDPDKELPLTYLSIKEAIDSSNRSMTVSEFIKFIMDRFFRTTHVKRNIYQLVEANYDLDVTVDKKTGRVFNGIYDFTNDEAKILLAISVFMKFVIPITAQYITTNTIYDDEQLSNVVTDVFVESFYRMGNAYGVEADDLLIKLYKFAETKILKHYGLHQLLWNQQTALRGLTESMHVDTILIKHLISNNMFKFMFNDNIVSFMKSIVETQLICTINKLKYKANPVRVDNTKDYNGLSGIDKLDQSMSKMDEGSIIKCTKSLQYEFARLERELGPISDDEHDYYYCNFLTTDPFHKSLVDYFYAKRFGGFTEMKNISADQYIDMMIWCKRQLQRERKQELPELISSNLEGRMSQRLLQNSKYINKLQQDETYTNMTNDTYRYLIGYNDQAILDPISKVLNNVYVYNSYECPELTGMKIEFNEDIISAELLTFIDSI